MVGLTFFLFSRAEESIDEVEAEIPESGSDAEEPEALRDAEENSEEEEETPEESEETASIRPRNLEAVAGLDC